MAVVIDDHLLLDVVAGVASPAEREAVANEVVYTTGCWYYRLARAVLAGSGDGSLSGRLDALGPEARDAALESIRRLPTRSACSASAPLRRSWPRCACDER